MAAGECGHIGSSLAYPYYRCPSQKPIPVQEWLVAQSEIQNVKLLDTYACDLSVIVVSFNTRDLLRECLASLLEECGRLPEGVSAEVLVVDNGSSDGSAGMVESEFSSCPTQVRLLRSTVNLGFAAANNLAFVEARGKYLVMLNSDAFLHPGALGRALQLMESSPDTGVGGAKLVGRDGAWQASGRRFPSLWRDALVLTGLSYHFPRSRIFGAPDRTWANPEEPAEVDWVPGAFSILRREALAKTGSFDPAFFLYYEEVDLYRRIKAAGYRVQYWPQIVVTHLVGESGRQLQSAGTVSRVELWRMRSALLYYRKHHGWQAWLARWLEQSIYHLRWLRNCRSKDPVRRKYAEQSAQLARLMRQAWKETDGGRVSPPRPW